MKTLMFMYAIISTVFELILNKFGIIQFADEPEMIEILINDTKFGTISKSELEKAVTAKKIAIKDDNSLVFTKSDYEIRKKNEDAAKYNEGKVAGVEMMAKDLKKDFALEDIEGKDVRTLFTTYATRKIEEAKVPESKKVKEHEETIKQLRENLAKIETEKNDITKSFTQKEAQLQINNTLSLSVPEQAITENMSRTDIIALFRAAGYDAIAQEGKILPTKDGQIMKHAVTLEPLLLKDILTKFVTDKKLLKTEGGTGKGDEIGNAGADSYTAFVKEMADKGIAENTEKFVKEMQMRIKNKTLKI